MGDAIGQVPKLGFGLMRLPRLADDPNRIDIEQTKVMVDMFLDAGFTYFDTAYAYPGSEEAIREALVKRHPRDTFTLATKLNARMSDSPEAARDQTRVSLERLGTDYVDYYLLHAIQAGNVDTYNEWGMWDYARELKEKGIVRKWGFSFHANADLLDELLTKHPDVDFVQLQLNYADWESPSIQSRANWEVARRHGKPVVVMEPVKGGTLANPPQVVKDIFNEANPQASLASWAIRYIASQEGILTVLSGMSNIEQMADNLSYMRGFEPMGEAELAVVRRAQDELARIDSIPCTGCSYCTPGCPLGINIPRIFQAMNSLLIFDDDFAARRAYSFCSGEGTRASDCLQCGQCERACPQGIDVIAQLERVAEALE